MENTEIRATVIPSLQERNEFFRSLRQEILQTIFNNQESLRTTLNGKTVNVSLPPANQFGDFTTLKQIGISDFETELEIRIGMIGANAEYAGTITSGCNFQPVSKK